MIVIPVEMTVEQKVTECRPVARSTIALSVSRRHQSGAGLLPARMGPVAVGA